MELKPYDGKVIPDTNAAPEPQPDPAKLKPYSGAVIGDKPDATVGDVLKETAASAVENLGEIPRFGGELVATGLNKLTGTEDFRATNPLKPAADAISNTITPGGQAAMGDGFKGDILRPSTWEAPQTGSGWAMNLAQGAGSMLTSLVPLGGLKYAGMGERALIAAGAGMDFGMTAGQASTQTRDEINKMGHDDLMANVPAYRDAVNGGMKPEAAKVKVGNDAGLYAGLISGIFGAMQGGVNAKLLDDLIAEKGVSAIMGKLSKRGYVRAAGGAAAGAVGEGIQEGMEQAGQNVGENIGRGDDAFKDVGRDTFGNVVLGAAMGGPMGGVFGHASHAPDGGAGPGSAPGAVSPALDPTLRDHDGQPVLNDAGQPVMRYDPAAPSPSNPDMTMGEEQAALHRFDLQTMDERAKAVGRRLDPEEADALTNIRLAIDEQRADEGMPPMSMQEWQSAIEQLPQPTKKNFFPFINGSAAGRYAAQLEQQTGRLHDVSMHPTMEGRYIAHPADEPPPLPSYLPKSQEAPNSAATEPSAAFEAPPGGESETPQEQASPVTEGPAYTGIDRRTNQGFRMRVSDMTPEERAKALLTSEKTGIPNDRAYEEAPKRGVQASLDADNLKKVNDTLGHDAGNVLIGKIGEALKAVAEKHGIDVFHLHGDEFAAQHEDEGKLRAALDEAQERLKSATITVQTPDGRTLTHTGIGFGYGTGQDFKTADFNLQSDKARRKQLGLRTDRDEPGHVPRQPSEGEQAGGGESAPGQVAPSESQGESPTASHSDAPSEGDLNALFDQAAEQVKAGKAAPAADDDSWMQRMLPVYEKLQDQRRAVDMAKEKDRAPLKAALEETVAKGKGIEKEFIDAHGDKAYREFFARVKQTHHASLTPETVSKVEADRRSTDTSAEDEQKSVVDETHREISGRLDVVEAAEAQLNSGKVLPDKKRKALQDEVASQHRHIASMIDEVENAFGTKVAEELQAKAFAGRKGAASLIVNHHHALKADAEKEKASADLRGPLTEEEADRAFPRAGETVDGRVVRKEIPNRSSISASMTDYALLSGVREVPMSIWKDYKPTTGERETKLADEIRESGEINPLIVAYDNEGPYILEGGHRFDALHILKAKSFPAIVVIDESDGTVDADAHQAATNPENDKDHPTTAEQAAGNYEKGHTAVADMPISVENTEGSTRYKYNVESIKALRVALNKASINLNNSMTGRTAATQASMRLNGALDNLDRGNPEKAVEHMEEAEKLLRGLYPDHADVIDRILEEGWHTKLPYHYGYFLKTVAPDKDHVDVAIKPGTPKNYSGPVQVVAQNHADGTYDEPKVFMGYATPAEARAAYIAGMDNAKKAESLIRGVRTFPMEGFKKWVYDAALTKQSPVGAEKPGKAGKSEEAAPALGAQASSVAHPQKFSSGMSRPGDFTQALAANHSIGVEIGELSKVSIPKIAEALVAAPTAKIFVDTGAFTLFRAQLRAAQMGEKFGPLFEQQPEGLDFKAIFDKFDALQSALSKADEENGGSAASDRAYWVMPDIVGDQRGSLDLLREHQDEVTGHVGWGKAIIPLQVGELSLAQAYDEAAKIIGRDDLIVGIPSNEKAVSDEQFREFIKARGDRITGVHLLGSAAGKQYAARLKALEDAKFEGEVSADANRLRAIMSGSTTRAEAMRKLLNTAPAASLFDDKGKATPEAAVKKMTAAERKAAEADAAFDEQRRKNKQAAKGTPWEHSRDFTVKLDDGREVQVKYQDPSDSLNGTIGGVHFEFSSPAISETGFLSSFQNHDVLTQYESPEEFAAGMAQHLADQLKPKGPSAKEQREAAKQAKVATRAAQADLFNALKGFSDLHILSKLSPEEFKNRLGELARQWADEQDGSDALRAKAVADLKAAELDPKMIAAVKREADRAAKLRAEEDKKNAPDKPKLRNTGVDLRRHWELVKAELKARDEAEGVAGMNRIFAATTRADLFANIVPESATPATKIYVDRVRDKTKTFKEWLLDGSAAPLRNLWGKTEWRDSPNTKIESWVRGSAYTRGVEGGEEGSASWDVQKRLDKLSEWADQYLGMARKIVDLVAGKEHVADAVNALNDAIWAEPNALQKHGTYGLMNESALTPLGRQISPMFDQFQAWKINRGAGDIAGLLRNEASIKLEDRQRVKPLTPPKLENIVRDGLKEVRTGNVTPAEFKERFGFADIGFGSWVNSKEDQAHLNHAWDAFSDLADFVGIPYKAIGFGGKLHFTLGALGHGSKAAATFTRGHPGPNGPVEVINLTKTKGDGTVAHEWFHALDYYLSGMRRASYARSSEDYAAATMGELLNLLTTKRSTYDELRAAAIRGLKGQSWMKGSRRAPPLENAASLIDYYARRPVPTQYKRNADAMDPKYWGNEKEIPARAFEAFVSDTLKGTNNYLVNPDWVGEGLAQPPMYKGTPYPMGEERKFFAEAFKAFVASLRTNEDGSITIDRAKWTELAPNTMREAQDAAAGLKAELPMLQAQLEREAEMAKNPPVVAPPKAAPDTDDTAWRFYTPAGREALLPGRGAVLWHYLTDTEKGVLRTAYELDKDDPARQAQDAQAREDEATMPSPAPAPAPTEQLGDVDLERLFDVAAETVRTENGENPDAPAPGEPALFNETPKPAQPAAKAPAAPTQPGASQLIAEAAKLGVKGIDEALTGLAKLFGGGKLSSFPGSFDEETYAKAKPHFEAALKAFQEAGKTLLDLFKLLIEQSGEGIKPYALRFAKDMKLTSSLGQQTSATAKIADWVKGQLYRPSAQAAMSWQELFKRADEAYGGSQAEGKYTPKDAYDAVEAGMNRYILERADKAGLPLDPEAAGARVAIATLKDATNRLPTATKRTAEQDEFQQFSTVPALAYVANWVANIQPGETMGEPSAGTGGLAVFAKAMGASVVANELSSRRAAILREVLPDARVFSENAEQIANVLPEDTQPTVIVMNPPFSSTAGRVAGERDSMNGAKHIESALSWLQSGGRLVAIVGKGMAEGEPRFAPWWQKIKERYNVRAILSLNGEEYAKYGTTYDNVIFVIDKTGPTTGGVVTGRVEQYADLPALLEGVRNDRKQPLAADRAPEQPAAQPSSGEAPAPGLGEHGLAPRPDTGTVGDAAGNLPGAGGEGVGPRDGGAPGGNGLRDGGGRRKRGAAPERPGQPERGGSGQLDLGGDQRPDERVELDVAGAQKRAAELTDSIFEAYTPLKARVKGAKPHPGKLVESAAMAAVEPTDATYSPNLPRETIEQGRVSDAQIEAVIYAGQAHSEMLPDGKRRGYFIGDGTGVGKGREIASIILDNMRQGRKKSVWISASSGLIRDAKRDFGGVTGRDGKDVDEIFGVRDVGAGGAAPAGRITRGDGIAFLTYDTLKGGEKQLAGPKAFDSSSAVTSNGGVLGNFVKYDAKKDMVTYLPSAEGASASSIRGPYVDAIAGDTKWKETLAPKAAAGMTTLKQLVEWVGPDYDGVIAFDEAHKMKNLGGQKGARGKVKPAQRALVAQELRDALPNARIVYVSATGATEVSNLAYADRLGLWGPNTSFTSADDFTAKIGAAGLAAMELVARDMKAMGAYISRSLSYDGVEQTTIDAPFSPLQKEIYDDLAKAWQIVLKNVNAALESTGANKNGQAKSAARSAFWSTQQRFFNQVITSMMTPSVLDRAQAEIAQGNAVLFQLVNTNEATQERLVEAAEAEDTALEELDFSPKQSLIEYLRKSFPVAAYEDYVDDNGNRRSRPVVDSKGNPVIDKDAEAQRDALIEHIEKNLRVPENPIDLIYEALGEQNVAEVSGRGRRFQRIMQKDGSFQLVERKRTGKSNEADAAAFMDDKKKALIFTDAGGTGYSFHSDLGVKNQRRRFHILLQPGWVAENAMQGIGRTHRSNEANQPVVALPKSDLKAQKRFISSIARRLDQLGALTKGQRNTASQGLFTNRDNLESRYAQSALRSLLEDMAPMSRAKGGPVENAEELISAMGLEEIYNEDNGGITESKMPTIQRFLNRLLSLTTAQQDQLFGEFERRMDAVIDAAVKNGTYDDGMQTLKALKVAKLRDEVVHTDQRSKAQTRYVELELTQGTILNSWQRLQEELATHPGQDLAYYYDHQGQQPFAVVNQGSRMDGKGMVRHYGYRFTVTANSARSRGTYIANRDSYERGGDNLRRMRDESGRLTAAPGYTGMAKDVELGVGALRRYKKISPDEAQYLWGEAYESAPKTYTEPLSLLTGALLPIWDRINAGSDSAVEGKTVAVVRTQTDEGERLIGRVISPDDRTAILKNLGVGAIDPNMSAADIIRRVLEQGDTAQLANGWLVKRSRVSNENRLEVIASYLSYAQKMQMQRDGFILERIGHQERLFLPTGNPALFDKLTRDSNRPVVDFIQRSGEALAEDRSGKFTTPKRLAEALKGYENKTVSADELAAIARSEIAARRAARENKDDRDRTRGYDWLRERLIRARRTGEMSREGVDLAAWLLEKNPAIAGDLGISIREGNEQSPNGTYNALRRLVTIFTSQANDFTLTHEILHHTEKMMPPAVQAAIREEWANRVGEQVDKLLSRVGEEGGPDRTTLMAFKAAAVAGDEDITTALWSKVLQNYGVPYDLSNASEFWAVNGAKLVGDRFAAAQGGWIAQARQWLREFIDRAKALFGLTSDTPIVKGLEAILASAGDRPPGSDAMISKREGYEALDLAGRRQQAVNGFNDLVRTSKQFNWWDRTVGTQLNKATKNPWFRRVFETGQNFLQDVSEFASRSMDEAPNILLKLENLSDVLKVGAKPDELAAVAKAIFSETLDRATYDDAKLRSEFGLDDRTISFYHEARRAIARSLKDLAASEYARKARNMGLDDAIAAAKASPDEAANILTSAIDARIAELRRRLSSYVGKPMEGARREVQAQIGVLTETQNEINSSAERIAKLISEGYAPLMRFGKYTVHVTHEGKAPGTRSTDFFGMYESEREANAAARTLQAEFPGSTIDQGIMSQEAWKLFQGVSPDTLEVFAEALGAEEKAIFQQYLKMAVNNRSVMKRLIHRKGTAGFSYDLSRVMASFITSNARRTSGNYHFADMNAAANAIPRSEGDVKDEAIRLAQYLQQPQDEAAGFRSFLFAQFIGGSVASAATNLTQPLLMTFPYLHQFGATPATMMRAGKVAATGAPAGSDLALAMEKAAQDGVVAPNEIHQLYAESMRSLGSNIWVRRFARAWGSLFAVSEGFNRRLTFAAAYETAKRAGRQDAYGFAVRAVEETQGIYNRGNRPNAARGAVGATLFTFKQFSVSYLEMLSRLPRKQQVLALAILLLAAGVQGFPFADDLDDLLDTVGQSLGYNTNAKAWKRKVMEDALGHFGGQFVLNGFSALPGVPLDVQGRLGLGNLIPGTAIFKRSETDKTRDVLEFAGPAGSLAQNIGQAVSKVQGGDIMGVNGALAQLAPTALVNMMKAAEMEQLGAYRDSKGRKVIAVDGYDAFVKALGFQPSDVAQDSRVAQQVQQNINMARTIETSIADKWAQGLFEHDAAKVAEAQMELRRWNTDNPTTPIRVLPTSIAHRVQDMMRTRDQRMAKHAPPTMRASVIRDLKG